MIRTVLDDLPAPPSSRLLGWSLLDARPAVSAYSEEAGMTFADAPGEGEEEGEGAAEDEADEPPHSGGEGPASA